MPSPPDETSLAETGFQSGAAGPASGGSRARGRVAARLAVVVRTGRPQEALTPGTLLAERYRILGLVGRGGMGEVYRAEDLRLGQNVALKFLPAAVAEDPQRLAQFHHEVRIARQVSHRNVCRVYDIGEDHGRVFLTMELIDGEDLALLLKRIGRFPEERATEIARQICAGLAAAHDLGVLHRDLKPANIMLDARRPRPHHRLRPGRPRRQLHRHPLGDAGLHGAGAARRPGRQRAQRHLLARPGPVTRSSPASAPSTRRRSPSCCASTTTACRCPSGTSGPHARSGRRAGHRALPGAAIRRSGRRARWRSRRRCPAAIRWPRPSPPARRRRRRWSPPPAASSRCRCAIGLAAAGVRRSSASAALIALRQATAFYRFMPVDLPPAGARGPGPPGARSLRLPRAAGRQRQPAARRRRLPARGPASAAGADALGPAGHGPRRRPSALVSHQPAVRSCRSNEWTQVPPTDPPLRMVGMTYVDVDAKGALLDFIAVPPQRTPAGRAVGRRRWTGSRCSTPCGWPRDALHAGDAGVDAAGRRPTCGPPGPARCPSSARRRCASKRRPSPARSSSSRRSVRGRGRAACRRRSRAASERALDVFKNVLVLLPDGRLGAAGAADGAARPRRLARRHDGGRWSLFILAHGAVDRRRAPRAATTAPTRTSFFDACADRSSAPASPGSPTSASSRGSGATGRPA